MRHLLVILLAAVWAGTAWHTAAQAPDTARALLDRYTQATAGRDTPAGAYDFRAQGIFFALEQSERPRGPQILKNQAYAGTVDLAADRLVMDFDTDVPMAGPDFRQSFGMAHAGGNRFFRFGGPDAPWRPAPGVFQYEMQQFFWGAPDWLVRQARAADDLRVLETEAIHNIAHTPLRFRHGGRTFTLYFNGATGLLTRVAVASSFDDHTYLRVWGRSVYTLDFGYWTAGRDGHLTPKQVDVMLNGQRLGHLVYDSYEPAAGPVDIPAIPEETVAAAAAMRAAGHDHPPFPETMEQVGEGVFTLPGAWYMGVVQTRDGLVLLDAPINQRYVREAEAFLRDRLGRVAAAVVMTSTAWPHFGGVPYFLNRQVPVYGFHADAETVARLAHANGTNSDSFRPVQVDRTIGGEGGPRITIAPLKGAATERMMVAWLPQAGLLYTSDTIQVRPDGTIFPHARAYVRDVIRLVCARGWDVQAVFGMHLGRTDWADIVSRMDRLPENCD